MTKAHATAADKKIGVCLGAYVNNDTLINAARSRASQEGCAWYAIYVEEEGLLPDTLAQQHIDQTLAHVKQYGGHAIMLHSANIIDGILTAAELHDLAYIIVGKRNRPAFQSWLRPAIASQLLKQDTPFQLQVITIAHNESQPGTQERSLSGPVKAYGISILLVALVTAIVDIIQESLPEYRFNASIYNVSMVYLLAIVFCALRYGVWPATIASILSFALYNYFFVTPFYAFGLGQLSDVLNFALFLSASLISVTIADAYKRNMLSLRERESAARALHDLSKDVAGSGNTKEVVRSLSKHLHEILQSDVMLLVYTDSRFDPSLSQLPNRELAIEEAADKAFETQQIVNHRQWYCYPLSTPSRSIGVIAVRYAREVPSPKLIEALCYQAALAIERTFMMQESEDIRLNHQRELLRSALLSSVSHDLKTPLVSIIGALSSIRHMQERLSTQEQHELLSTALEEAERLNQFISNILSMTRIESGALTLKREWISVYSLYADAIQRQEHNLYNHTVDIDSSSQDYNIEVDPVLFSQLIQNLLENSAKYSPSASAIRLSVVQNHAALSLCITDEGPGIAVAERQRVFDKFTRLEQRDSRIAGTGLGLAICKAITDIHEGTISLHDNPSGMGLRVSVQLSAYTKA